MGFILGCILEVILTSLESSFGGAFGGSFEDPLGYPFGESIGVSRGGIFGRAGVTGARVEVEKIVGVQIVVYGFRTSDGVKIEEIAERCSFFGFGICTESVQRKFEQRDFQKRSRQKF